jgi:glyceraldehyde-3-phosphate dehydrogenase [NAD(P)+]
MLKPIVSLDLFFTPVTKIEGEIPVFRNFIGGRWVESNAGGTLNIDTPVDGTIIAKVQDSSPEDVEKAIESAVQAQNSIREIAGIDRIAILDKARELLVCNLQDIARTLCLEAGKPLRDAKAEVNATADRIKLTMEEARKIFGEYIPGDWSEDTVGKIALAIREPIGVIAAISSFNYPLFIPSAKIIPALLAGNSVISKPAGEDPLVLLLFGRILQEAGLPDGALNIVTGQGSRLGESLVSDPRIGMITFTGSTQVGKNVMALSGLKRLHLELGGKGVAIVLEDANLALAAERCVEGSLKNSGQRCDAISLILIVDPVADTFIQEVLAYVEKWKVGDPRSEDVNLGPLINEAAARHVQMLVDDAVARGGELLKGGSHRGCYFEPTIMDKVPFDARIAQEETFGPVVTVARVSDEDQALSFANQSRYGLDSCVFTNNFYRIWKISKRLQTGAVTINDLPRHGVGYFPFGGIKESGIGREGVGYSIDEMTNLKTIVFNLEPARLGKLRSIHRM